MSIGTKLGIGFGVVFSLMIGIFSIGILELNKLNQAADKMASQDWKKAELINEANGLVLRNAVNTFRILHAPDARTREAIGSEIDRNKDLITAYFEKVESMLSLAEEKRLLTAIKETRVPYVVSFTEVRALLDRGETEAATKIAETETIPRLETFVAEMAELVAFQTRLIDVRAREAATAYVSARIVLLVFTIAAIVIAALFAFFITRNITKIQSLNVSVEEKELLLREAHHRIKNNLAVISSIIHMEASQSEDEAFRGSLEQLAVRVGSIGTVHTLLYKRKNLTTIDLAEYFSRLVEAVMDTMGREGLRLDLNVSPGFSDVSEDLAVPLGLIVNELVTNSVKHAFPANRPGRIHVSLEATDKGGRLEVGDDGTGMKAEAGSGLGLQLVTVLVEQIQGKLEVSSDGGTVAVILFPFLYSNQSKSA